MLYEDGLTLIRRNLETISKGEKAKATEIGEFTVQQHAEINNLRLASNLQPLESPKIVFIGSHLYKSRIAEDGYTIDDVIKQIASVFSITSIVIHTRHMTGMRSTVKRQDGYGNEVLDEAVFELTQRKPKAELFSVIPKGDHLKIKKKK
ncbi:hypothetical protein ACO0K0_20460 [Undibacterium sp. SXout11W]